MTLKFKEGDVVLVEAVVVETDDKDCAYPYYIKVDGQTYGYWANEDKVYARNSVEQYKQSTTWNNIEVGDIIKHDVFGTAYSVVRLGDDRVFTTDTGGYILYKDIVVIYKKSWEKSMSLEDMSKEELIELVKQLKGEV